MFIVAFCTDCKVPGTGSNAAVHEAFETAQFYGYFSNVATEIPVAVGTSSTD